MKNTALNKLFNSGLSGRVLIVLIVISFLLGILCSQFSFLLFVLSGDSSSMNLISVGNGHHLELILTDSTKVCINSGTEFQFSNTFAVKGNRVVMLHGEAYFEVSKNSSPFIVKTQYGNISTLGTKFNISAYDNGEFAATLIEGKIKYKINRIEKIVEPGQQVIVDNNKRISIRNVNVESYLQWKDGIISFTNEELGNVVKKLERNYDVSIRLDSDLALIKFTGELKEESIEDVLSLVNRTIPIDYEYHNKTKSILIKRSK